MSFERWVWYLIPGRLIGLSVANGSVPMRSILERSSVFPWGNDAEVPRQFVTRFGVVLRLLQSLGFLDMCYLLKFDNYSALVICVVGLVT